ncbi:MAG: hypothetical protein Q4G27_09685 [Flavobacteriaceae bacterium]|nr:hypothetical protein [Flavobacteriaceae bacterium]
MHGIQKIGKVKRLGLGNDEKVYGNKSLSVRFVSCNLDNENFNLTFEVEAYNLNADKAILYVGENEVFGSEEAVTTNVTINPNGRRRVIASFSRNKTFSWSWFEGDFEFIATISCDGLSHTSDEFKLKCAKAQAKSSINDLPLKEVICPPLNLTVEQKNEFIATVFCESGLGEWELREVGWIYFNLVSDLKFQTALNRSSAHKEENIWYKTCMCYITNKVKYKNDQAPKYAQVATDWFGEETYGDFVDSDIFNRNYKSRIDKLRNYIEQYIFSSTPRQKYKGWYGQGYWGDMMIIDGRDNGKWHKARQYYWLQLSGRVSKKYVQILISKNRGKTKKLRNNWENNTTFIFDENSIIEYFEKNPSMLPKINDIKSFVIHNDDKTFDLNFNL